MPCQKPAKKDLAHSISLYISPKLSKFALGWLVYEVHFLELFTYSCFILFSALQANYCEKIYVIKDCDHRSSFWIH